MIDIYHGDCLEIMRNLPAGSVDMVLCDLPYQMTANKWDLIIPPERLWEEYHRVCKETAVVALFGSQPFSSLMVMSNVREFRHEWIWIKNRGSNFANTVREPMKEHEHIIIFSKGKWTYNKQMQERAPAGAQRIRYSFNGVTKSENYREFTRRQNRPPNLRVPSSYQKFNIEIGLHPTQKPVPLLEYLIKTYTNERETVLDNCMGSGSTGEPIGYECAKYFNNLTYFEKRGSKKSIERILFKFDSTESSLQGEVKRQSQLQQLKEGDWIKKTFDTELS